MRVHATPLAASLAIRSEPWVAEPVPSSAHAAPSSPSTTTTTSSSSSSSSSSSPLPQLSPVDTLVKRAVLTDTLRLVGHGLETASATPVVMRPAVATGFRKLDLGGTGGGSGGRSQGGSSDPLTLASRVGRLYLSACRQAKVLPCQKAPPREGSDNSIRAIYSQLPQATAPARKPCGLSATQFVRFAQARGLLRLATVTKPGLAILHQQHCVVQHRSELSRGLAQRDVRHGESVLRMRFDAFLRALRDVAVAEWGGGEAVPPGVANGAASASGASSRSREAIGSSGGCGAGACGGGGGGGASAAGWCSKFEQGSRAADYVSKACSPEVTLHCMETLMAHVRRTPSPSPSAASAPGAAAAGAPTPTAGLIADP